jgi:hypothetical protein
MAFSLKFDVKRLWELFIELFSLLNISLMVDFGISYGWGWKVWEVCQGAGDH